MTVSLRRALPMIACTVVSAAAVARLARAQSAAPSSSPAPAHTASSSPAPVVSASASSSPEPHASSSPPPESEDDEAPSGAPPERCAAPTVEVDREHHCCRPGQRFAHAHCDGAPSVCEPGFVRARSANECTAAACTGGRVRDENGTHCCWPGQHFDAHVMRCIGEVEHCPEGTNAIGDSGCAPPLGPMETRARAGLRRGAAWIPGGTFAMDRGGDRIVTVEPFAIDRTEVTVSAYAACVRASRCDAPHDAFRPARADAPRTDVTFAMARAYCGFAGGRLPTEAEWELAARGFDRRDYPWGSRLPDCTLARFNGCGDGAASVGSLANGASPFGVRDMAGNVAEWVADRSAALTWSSEWNPTGATHGRRRVVRGGSFTDNAVSIRATARRSMDPDEARFDVGFRCVY